MKQLALLFLLGSLAACGGDTVRYAVAPPEVTKQIRISFGAVEVRDVSLPTYAAAEEISVRTADGTLTSASSVLWADDPERAVTLELTRNLARMTRARIAGEPWPFEAFPDARLEVRFADMIAGDDGQFRISGQYFVAALDGGAERSGLFDLAVPYLVEGGPAAVANARGQVILDLAELIARKGLR